jgi:hypothetical protein
MENQMTLHHNKELFSELITRTSEMLKMPEIYIEKDYWVTYILFALSQMDADIQDKVVFKGGTSLSKAHRLIERFSEDIDLAVVAEGLNGNQTKKLLKTLEKSLAQLPLKEIADHPQMTKGSEYRKSVYAYPQLREGDFGDAVNVIILELNTFAHPTPNSKMTVSTYINAFLEKENREDIVSKYAMDYFEVSVLDLKRTLCEKISAIARASYDGDAEMQKKIRHLYDIHLLLQKPEIQTFLGSDAFDEMMNIVKDDDSDNKQFNEDWAGKPILDAPVFKETSLIMSRLHSYYHETFRSLVYGELPDMQTIEESILILKGRLQ